MVHWQGQGLRPDGGGEVSLKDRWIDITKNTHIMMVNLEACYVVPVHIVPVRHHVPILIHTVGNN
jgi:hypothetical protein